MNVRCSIGDERDSVYVWIFMILAYENSLQMMMEDSDFGNSVGASRMDKGRVRP